MIDMYPIAPEFRNSSGFNPPNLGSATPNNGPTEGGANIALAGTSLLAHQVTFKGTVVSIDKTSVKVTVVDEKTKRPVQKSFDFDKDTKILRGDKLVSIEQARIVKGEKISVTIDHDADETLAIVIRLDPKAIGE